jgi:ribosomal protein S18 acetylase RimI-like enzyme
VRPVSAPELSRLTHRPATPADTEPLLGLIAAYYAHDHLAFDAAQVREGLGALLSEGGPGRVYLAELEGEVAGYGVLTFGFDYEFGGRLATLTDLFFQPHLRRQGLGSATLAFLAAECRAAGIRALELQVETDNLAAQALYRKFGFRPLPRLPMIKRL